MKRTVFHRLLALLAVALAGVTASAQDDASPDPIRPVVSAYMFNIGGAKLVNTYLTPIKYSGVDFGFAYERMQAMKFNPERWVMRLEASIDMNKTENPVRNADMWRLVGDVSWGMTYRWRLPYGITVAAGGSSGLDLGCMYNPRNGNNPVAVEAAWTVNASGYATWQTKVWNLPVTLKYQTAIPVAGVFFSPDYGELFYEIYLGNHNGLAHFAWWGSYFRMDNLLTADIHFGATALRIGFRNDILSTKVNNIVTRAVTYSAVIGVAGEWMSLNPYKRPDSKARVISALY